MLASVNKPRPKYSGGLRPTMSDTGPYSSCPEPRARKNTVKRELHLAHLRAQALPDVGQGRQVHVDRKRTNGGDQAQDQGHFEVTGHRHGEIVVDPGKP